MTKKDFSPKKQKKHWDQIVDAGIKTQKILPDAIPVGGTIVAVYAGHRMSSDIDHLLERFDQDFEEILETLSKHKDWTYVRTTNQPSILGRMGQVQVGFRKMKRLRTIQTQDIKTARGIWKIPTFEEILGMKVVLCVTRRATRDFLDVAALAASAHTVEKAAESLMDLDNRFEGIQEHSLVQNAAMALSDPAPYDLQSFDLKRYKGIAEEWQDWSAIKTVCQNLGKEIARRLVP